MTAAAHRERPRPSTEEAGGEMTTTTTRPRGVGPRTAHDPGDPLVTSH